MEAKCNFHIYQDNYRSWNHPYTCSVLEITKPSVEKEITSFNGRHVCGKNKRDIEWFFVEDKPIRCVPKNLLQTFPKLKYLSLRSCGIEKVTREDLKGLEDLEHLSFGGNMLTSLPDDLFADMKKLRWIFFNDNKIERMSSKLLEPIKSTLEYVGLEKNARIDDFFDRDGHKRNNDLAKFSAIIDSKCLPVLQHFERSFAAFGQFKVSGDFSDLTLKLRGKEFKVHKMVLAAQSPVFRMLFAGEIETASNPFSKIKKISDETLEAFLNFFYTGKVDSSDSVFEMLELAYEFDVSELKLICTDRALVEINGSNAMEVFNLAHRFCSDDLKKKSFEIIQKLFPTLDASCEDKLDEVNTLMALQRQINNLREKLTINDIDNY